SPVPFEVSDDSATAQFELRDSKAVCFRLGASEAVGRLPADPQEILELTLHYWKNWVSQSNYRGRYREVVLRSALTLKLLSSSEHGAIVAAPTFGLAEALDGSRRWD